MPAKGARRAATKGRATMAVHDLGGKLLPFRRRCAVVRATDDALLADVAVGETSPLCELFYRYGDRVHRILAQTGAFDDLDQAVLASFLHVYRSAARFTGNAAVSSWIVAVALEALRDRRHAQLKRAPRGLVATLPRQWRLAILLVDGEGVKIPAAAAALRCTERTVWRWLDRAHRRLQAEPRTRPVSRVRRFLRTGRVCPARWKLMRAVCEDLDPRMGWHLSGCSECEREYVALLGLTARLSTLSNGGMTDAARARVAAILLAAGSSS
jgi:DNA-directed RNA polymerase specialized sigma24 family protein